MRFMRFLQMLFIIVLISSCVGGNYYSESNLNSISIGVSKEAFLQTYSGGGSEDTNGAILRAAQRQDNGELIEVLTLEMIVADASSTVDYGFVFKEGLLVQWGRPEDWQQVSGRYEISFNPSASVR